MKNRFVTIELEMFFLAGWHFNESGADWGRMRGWHITPL